MFVFNNLGVSVIGEVFTWCDVNQFEVKLCSALLRVLPVGIGSYLKPILRYKHLILYTYHPDTLYLRTQGCEDPWMLWCYSRPKWVRQQKKVGRTLR